MSTIDILGLGCVTSIYSPLMPSPVDIGRLHFQGTKGDNRYKIIDKEWYNRSTKIQENGFYICGHFYASATSTQYLFTKKSPLFWV